MNLKIAFKCRVSGKVSERANVDKLNDEIQRLGLMSFAENMQRVTMDESLMNDFNRVINDLGSILRRARARKARR